MDETAKEELIKELKSRRQAQDTVTSREFAQLVQQKAKETNVKRGGNDLDVEISDDTIRDIRNQLNAATTTGQSKTEARVKAEADPRNAYSEALMLNAYQSNIDPALILNCDATQYFVRNSGEGDDLLVYIIDVTDDSPVTKIAQNTGDMGIFVKSYTLVSASGSMGPMVLVCADDSLDEDGLVVKQLNGISHIKDSSFYGYVVFTKTRAGSVSFYRWFVEEIICDYVQRVRTDIGLDDMPAFFSTDGEQRQIETFMEARSIALLEQAKIIDGKHSASYSAKGNALDMGNYFKATKTRVKHLSKAMVESNTYRLRAKLDDYMRESHPSWTKDKRNHHIDAICRIVTASQKTYNVDIIHKSFISVSPN